MLRDASLSALLSFQPLSGVEATMTRDFKIFAPMRLWKATDGPEERRLRIAGVISTENIDQQGETLLQRGLDFGHFLHKGWFNDNHSQKTVDVLGEPEVVRQFQKGQELPDGTQAYANLHWCEGFLYPDHEPAQRIWRLANAIEKSGSTRRLGFSVEGKIKQRAGADRKTVAKADVRNVAITANPVNADTMLGTLIKSLELSEERGSTPWELAKSFINEFGEPASTDDGRYLWKANNAEIEVRYDKALSTGSQTAGRAPTGGAGDGAALMPESLEDDERAVAYRKAVALAKSRLCTDDATARRVVDLAIAVEHHVRGNA